ncbi:MAG: DUF5132 domain-containing protein [Anaerolineales bacterium]|nr:DUF5132 domain-containing protein [Anaerolineales bacterium]
MEILAALLGIGVVAVSPLVPGLRPVAKSVIAGGLVVSDALKTNAAIAGEHWMDLVAEAKAERAAEAEARANIVETITIPLTDD